MGARLDSAIDRLESGTPTNEKVRARLASGKDICTPSCLSLEAPASRTLFGHAGCPYPKQRARLLRLRAPSVKAVRALGQVKELSAKCIELRQDVARRDAIIASQTIRIIELEKLTGDDGSTAARFRRKDRRLKTSKPAGRRS